MQPFVSWYKLIPSVIFANNMPCPGQEPDNYLTYYKRATAYLSLGRNNAAAQDFTTILTLKPDFDKALLQRARIYIKEGQFEMAIADLKSYLISHPNDKEAEKLVSLIIMLCVCVWGWFVHTKCTTV